MARLQDLRQAFSPLSWQEKLKFIEEYRTKRYNDLNTVQEFDLSKRKTTSSKKREAKEPKEKVVKKITKEAITEAGLSPEQISLLKQLGVLQ